MDSFKFMVSLEVILDLCHVMQIGGSFIEAIKKKILLLGQCEGLDRLTTERDLTNNCVKLEKTVIAVMSLIVTGSDLDDVVCYICGNCPKIVSTDGNTKDSIKVQGNMRYDYEDDSEIPDLQEYKELLVEDVLKSVFFQEKRKTWNMLKVPIVCAPSLIGKQVNTEVSKKTLLEKQFSYKEDTLAEFQGLVNKKVFKISSIGHMNGQEIRNFAKQVGIDSSKKSIEILKTDFNNLSGILLGGQGICHKYIYERGRTGGWQDMHCDHLFKVAAKIQACQESVSDPSDLIHTLKKWPVVTISDDSCTLRSHEGLKYPVLAEYAFGETGGCFEMPSEDIAPRTGISCPDITPIELEDKPPNRQAMLNPSTLVHPDVATTKRYVLGTRLQMREKGTSHKRTSCGYHNLDNAIEGSMLKSMNQEAMQVVRKSKTIQADKMRSFQTCFLANMIQDYFHNLNKHKDQLSRYQKMDDFEEVTRDSLTLRACVKTKAKKGVTSPPMKKQKKVQS